MKEITPLGEAIGRLIVARLDGSITPEENAVLTAWLDASPDHWKIYAEYAALSGGLRPLREVPDPDAALERVWAKADRKARRARRIWRYTGIAAAAAVLIGVGVLLLRPSSRPEEPSASVYRLANVDNPSMHVSLPDGSDVWLRPGSELRYDASFNTVDRCVELSGEAYFDVEKDPERPFYVVTEEFRVRVLGTAFSVRNPLSGAPEVTLARGSVAMQTPEGRSILRLRPGQKATWSGEDGLFDITEVPVSDLLLTGYGVISLTDATLEEIVSSIEAQYGITIAVSPGGVSGSHRYNFNYQKDSSPASVVELLGFMCHDKKFAIVNQQ